MGIRDTAGLPSTGVPEAARAVGTPLHLPQIPGAAVWAGLPVVAQDLAGHLVIAASGGLNKGTLSMYALIKNTLVVNVIIADQAFADSIASDWDAVVPATPDVGIGWAYVDGVFTAPTQPTPPADPCEWLIDIGPFFDRFGAAKMAVLTSADAGVKAILSDVQVRKWIDLKRADVASSLAYIGSKVPSVDATLQTAILTTPVTAEEKLALRKLYF